ncbi:MAG TPA: hypothetical protein VIJ75_05190 [Hanamia sp.]
MTVKCLKNSLENMMVMGYNKRYVSYHQLVVWQIKYNKAIRNICKNNICKHPFASTDKIKVGKK